jgi:hypothetical protein
MTSGTQYEKRKSNTNKKMLKMKTMKTKLFFTALVLATTMSSFASTAQVDNTNAFTTKAGGINTDTNRLNEGKENSNLTADEWKMFLNKTNDSKSALVYMDYELGNKSCCAAENTNLTADEWKMFLNNDSKSEGTLKFFEIDNNVASSNNLKADEWKMFLNRAENLETEISEDEMLSMGQPANENVKDEFGTKVAEVTVRSNTK